MSCAISRLGTGGPLCVCSQDRAVGPQRSRRFGSDSLGGYGRAVGNPIREVGGTDREAAGFLKPPSGLSLVFTAFYRLPLLPQPLSLQVQLEHLYQAPRGEASVTVSAFYLWYGL